jgi:5'-phosphate synthase pdxT subunit
VKIGVLAVQGNFREHIQMLRRLGTEAVEVRKPAELEGLDGLVVPGGESTTFMRLMRLYGLDEAVRRFQGPVLGTCAGMIVLDRDHLGLVDVTVDRNAYGRQVASFEAELRIAGDDRPLRGVFIRAPRVRESGPGVEVLADMDGEPVALREGRFIVASFHPELTDDTRIHERFLDLVKEANHSRAPGAPLAKETSGRGAGQYIQYGQAPPAQYPAASGVRWWRRPAPPAVSHHRPGARDVGA